MASPQSGQGNVVDPLSTSGTPEAVQNFARSDMVCTPQCRHGHGLPLFMLARDEGSTI
jgi:hypothetical protein